MLFDDSFVGDDVSKLVEFTESLGIPVKFVSLVDYANSRGAIDMGVAPELHFVTLEDAPLAPHRVDHLVSAGRVETQTG